MEKRIWNAHQQSAIDTRGKSVVVSAAAGSGKTSVLTERVLRLIMEGEDIENMLIVTFTNLAACEMRERIYKRLQEASHAAPRLAVQAEKCAFADISTLHAFCGRLIRDNFEQAGTSPAFAIADDVQTGRLKEAAFEQALQQAAEALLPLIDKFSRRGDTANIKRLVLSIYNRAVSLKDPQGWLEAARAYFDGGCFIGVLFEEFKCMARDAAQAAEPYLLERTALWRDKGYAAEADLSERDYRVFMRQAQSLSAENVFLPEAAHISAPGKGAPNRSSATLTNSANRQFEALRGYAGNFYAKVADEMAKTADDGRFFIHLTQLFMERYARLKRAKNLLDHDDTMHFALKALGFPEVASRYCGRYAHVFVDEYQDINEAQHAIIGRLQRGGNDFLVGDVKQCIYTFRESNPDLLMRRCRELEGDGLIEMNTNYRSVPAVVDFINDVMSYMMDADSGGVDYTGGQMLAAGSKGDGCVEVVLAGREEETNLQAEAAEIAVQVEKLAAQGFGYHEIAVLRPEMRNSGRQIAEALMRAGIPAVNGFGAAEADFGELAVFINLLALIDGSGDDTAWLSVMRFPCFGFTEPEFAQIRLAQQRDTEDKSFRQALLTFVQNSALGEKVSGFLAQIEHYARLCACMKLPDFLHRLRQEIRLSDYALTSPGGAACESAISSFISAAAAQRPACLADVLAVSDRLKSPRETQQSPKEAGGVYLTTIHKSKGLEFRAVILSGLHKKIDQRDMTGAVLVGRSLGLALDVMEETTYIKKPTLHKLAVARSLKREKISETVRLLYVGMTRAIERLVLLGAGIEIKDAWCAKKPKGWQHSAVKHFDLLMPAMHMACLKRGQSLEKMVQISQQDSHTKDAQQDREQSLEAFFDLAQAAEPAGVYNGYAFLAQIGVPSKVSVSALKRMNEAVLFRPVLSPSQDDGMTAAQRGTLTHRVLERIGLRPRTKEQLLSLLLEMEQQGIIEEGASVHVDMKAVCGFLQSELANRALKAEKCLLEQPFCLKMTAAECGLVPDSKELVIVQGVIDLCFLENGEWIVGDYKTDAVTSAKAPDAARKYAVQLSLYAKALKSITHISVAEKQVYFLSAGRGVVLD